MWVISETLGKCIELLNFFVDFHSWFNENSKFMCWGNCFTRNIEKCRRKLRVDSKFNKKHFDFLVIDVIYELWGLMLRQQMESWWFSSKSPMKKPYKCWCIEGQATSLKTTKCNNKSKKKALKINSFLTMKPTKRNLKLNKLLKLRVLKLKKFVFFSKKSTKPVNSLNILHFNALEHSFSSISSCHSHWIVILLDINQISACTCV